MIQSVPCYHQPSSKRGEHYQIVQQMLQGVTGDQSLIGIAREKETYNASAYPTRNANNCQNVPDKKRKTVCYQRNE